MSASDPDRTQRTVYRLTAADLDAIAGRTLSDEELEQVVKSIDANDVVADVIDSALASL